MKRYPTFPHLFRGHASPGEQFATPERARKRETAVPYQKAQSGCTAGRAAIMSMSIASFAINTLLVFEAKSLNPFRCQQIGHPPMLPDQPGNSEAAPR